VPVHEATFPLVLRRRLIGLAYGAMASARRGTGSDVAGSRFYRPGDDMDTIDWAASAKWASATGSDDFIVRERFAEEAPRVVLVVDRRPAMALYPPGLPWLSKPAALRAAGALVADSAVRANGFVGYVDHARGETEPFWRPPVSPAERWRVKESHLPFDRFEAPEDNLDRVLSFLGRLRGVLPSGSFLFVFSDFLVTPPREAWLRAVERRWDIVPVVIQDPVWEASFPDVGSVVLPVVDPATGKVRPVRLTAREAAARREANERRRVELVRDFRRLGLEPVLVESADPGDVLQAFVSWSDHRLYERRRGW
jgi:uncharacterized protein (DUF58 family)